MTLVSIQIAGFVAIFPRQEMKEFLPQCSAPGFMIDSNENIPVFRGAKKSRQFRNMQAFIPDNEAAIRPGFFPGIFSLMATWEILAPRRTLTMSKSIRWLNNIGLVAFNTFLLRLPALPFAGKISGYTINHRQWDEE